METKIENQSTLTYTLNGHTEKIIIKDNSDNQEFIDIKLGDCLISIPREAIYDLKNVLSKFED